ncbi:MAG: FAD:protein FMN transferase [Thiotrichales bacterium]
MLLVINGCSREQPVKLQGSTMGTSYSVVLPSLPENLDEQTLRNQIEALLKQVNQQMSTYIDDSELSLLNKKPSTDWIALSPELASVIKMALKVSAASEGAFDVTVGPLVNLWGFGPEGRIEHRPPAEKIAEAKSHVGYQKIELKDNSLRKRDPRLYIDLSGIAKGYGVDQIADYLETAGVYNYLVEIGGEIRAKGQSARNDAWRIAVEKPLPGQRSVDRVVHLSDIGVATSGDYRNFFMENGHRYSHTIDPRTSSPIDHHLVSVTVLDKQTAIADAWATALMVLGEKQGFELARSINLAAYFLVSNGDSYSTLETPEFSRLAELVE